ncbi:MAG: DUF7289 family protein [Methermicoccaceae archaeon]
MIGDERAVSTVVGAMLMLAVLMTMLSVLYSYYVPEWKAGLEYEHLSDVQMQFLELKSTLDSHLSMESGITTTSPIALGGGGLTFLSPMRSGGGVMIKPENGSVVIVANSTVYSTTTGTITYRSSNSFWLDQSFTYDNSAVLMTQGSTTIMRAEPMVLYRKSDGWLIMHAINITTPSHANESMAGNSIASIDVKKVSSSVLYNGSSNVSLFRIYTPFAHQWAEFFNTSDDLPSAVSVSEGDGYVELAPDTTNVSTLYVDATVFSVSVR